MTYKVLDIHDHINLVCIKNCNARYNPYRLYLIYPAHDKYGYPTKHRKQLAQYADMTSIICHIKDLYLNSVQYKSVEQILSWNKQYYAPHGIRL